MIELMRKSGAPAADIEAARAAAAPGEFEVLPDCWDSVRVFCALGSRWRALATPAGIVWQGLDDAAAERAIRRARIPPERRDQVWDDLMLMEATAAPLRNSRLRAAAPMGARWGRA